MHAHLFFDPSKMHTYLFLDLSKMLAHLFLDLKMEQTESAPFHASALTYFKIFL